MSGNNENDNERSVFQIRNKVYNANWRDDIAEEVREEKEETDFETFENEKEYVSSEIVSPEANDRIKYFEIKLERNFARPIGAKVLSFSKRKKQLPMDVYESLRKVA